MKKIIKFLKNPNRYLAEKELDKANVRSCHYDPDTKKYVYGVVEKIPLNMNCSVNQSSSISGHGKMNFDEHGNGSMIILVIKDIIKKKVGIWPFRRKTDVEEVGEIESLFHYNILNDEGLKMIERFALEEAAHLPFIHKAVTGGSEIRPFDLPYRGTLTGFFRKKGTSLPSPSKALLKRFPSLTQDKIVGLTNLHVLMEDVSDSKKKGVRDSQNNLIGTYLEGIPIRDNQDNYFDSCIFELRETNVKSEVQGFGEIEGFGTAHPGMTVEKVGRTTGLTEGECIAINATIKVKYGEDNYKTLKGVDVFTYMSESGDSGSPMLCENVLVSQLFAGSKSRTYGIPMMNIQIKFKLEAI